MGPPGGVPITWIANYGKRLRPGRPHLPQLISHPSPTSLARPHPSLPDSTRNSTYNLHSLHHSFGLCSSSCCSKSRILARAKNNRGWSMDKHEAMEYGQARSFLSSALSASMGSVLQSLVGTAAGFTRTARSSNARREKLKSSSL